MIADTAPALKRIEMPTGIDIALHVTTMTANPVVTAAAIHIGVEWIAIAEAVATHPVTDPALVIADGREVALVIARGREVDRDPDRAAEEHATAPTPLDPRVAQLGPALLSRRLIDTSPPPADVLPFLLRFQGGGKRGNGNALTEVTLIVLAIGIAIVIGGILTGSEIGMSGGGMGLMRLIGMFLVKAAPGDAITMNRGEKIARESEAQVGRGIGKAKIVTVIVTLVIAKRTGRGKSLTRIEIGERV